MEKRRPKVGLGVIIVHEGKVLIGKRIMPGGGHMWQFPGGHLELFESFEQCATREVMEEAGIEIKNPRFVHVTNDPRINNDMHYVTVFMLAEYAGGEIINCEPDKCMGWEWCKWEEIPDPKFNPIENLLADGFMLEL
ncbi:NUDIX domain-containing protein [Patescibacteria group bacterium]|nr:NUDIX domain-containing protein [Patescibacteria group bacterium]